MNSSWLKIWTPRPLVRLGSATSPDSSVRNWNARKRENWERHTGRGLWVWRKKWCNQQVSICKYNRREKKNIYNGVFFTFFPLSEFLGKRNYHHGYNCSIPHIAFLYLHYSSFPFLFYLFIIYYLFFIRFYFYSFIRFCVYLWLLFITGRKKLDKKKFEKMMMPIVEKHLLDKHKAKQTDANRLVPIPQTYTEDEQDFIDKMTPTEPEDLKQEKGENDDDFWERRSLAMLPKYDWLNPDLTRAKYELLSPPLPSLPPFPLPFLPSPSLASLSLLLYLLVIKFYYTKSKQ